MDTTLKKLLENRDLGYEDMAAYLKATGIRDSYIPEADGEFVTEEDATKSCRNMLEGLARHPADDLLSIAEAVADELDTDIIGMDTISFAIVDAAENCTETEINNELPDGIVEKLLFEGSSVLEEYSIQISDNIKEYIDTLIQTLEEIWHDKKLEEDYEGGYEEYIETIAERISVPMTRVLSRKN